MELIKMRENSGGGGGGGCVALGASELTQRFPEEEEEGEEEEKFILEVVRGAEEAVRNLGKAEREARVGEVSSSSSPDRMRPGRAEAGLMAKSSGVYEVVTLAMMEREKEGGRRRRRRSRI